MQNMQEIYKEHFETVKKYLFCLTHNNDISEELTQKTFYIAVKKIHTIQGKCKIVVWLCQIAKNLWYSELKKSNKYQSFDEKKITEILPMQTMEETVITNEKKIDLYKQMQKLHFEAREVIYLRITGELTFKEIAEIMNRTESWVRVTFYRAKQKLKEDEENE